MDDAPVNPLDDLVGYQLRRVSSAMMAELSAKLDALGLRPTEASVLLLIAANPGITQSEIGRMLRIKRANMAPLSSLLERRGLIVRALIDGRSHGLRTAPEGAALCRAARKAMDAHDARILAVLSPAQRTGLTAALSTLRS